MKALATYQDLEWLSRLCTVASSAWRGWEAHVDENKCDGSSFGAFAELGRERSFLELSSTGFIITEWDARAVECGRSLDAARSHRICGEMTESNRFCNSGSCVCSANSSEDRKCCVGFRSVGFRRVPILYSE